MTAERIHKVMARAGIGSRRQCEAWVEQGRVTVNGKIAAIGQTVVAGRDRIRLDGRLVVERGGRLVVALHKPPGVVSSRSPQGRRRTVCDLVPLEARLFPVGRLDLDSEGLILLTNDGELAQRLSHPRFGHEKEYRVLLDQDPDESQLSAWRNGGAAAGGRGAPARVWRDRSARQGRWIRVILREGRKRQIRESARSLGLKVRRLIRVRIGGLHLGRLAPGAWKILGPTEIRALVARSHRGSGGTEVEWRASR